MKIKRITSYLSCEGSPCFFRNANAALCLSVNKKEAVDESRDGLTVTLKPLPSRINLVDATFEGLFFLSTFFFKKGSFMLRQHIPELRYFLVNKKAS